MPEKLSGADREQSEFNMAVSYLNRLNQLFYLCDNSAINLDVYTWFHGLLALYRELYNHMKQDEINEWEKKITTINEKISIHIRRSQRSGSMFIPPDLYQNLHKFEVFIRAVLKKAGLETKLMDDMARALK